MANVATVPEDGNPPEKINKLFLKAVAAKEVANYDYAVSLLNAILGHSPDYEEAQRLLNEVRQVRGQG